MTRWAAFLRGVNVGGHGKLPMKDLRARMDEAGFSDVATYIQSGNVVFDRAGEPASVEKKLSILIEDHFGLRPPMRLMTLAALIDAEAQNPYPNPAELKHVHLWFLASAPATPDLEALQALKIPGEVFVLQTDIFYLHAPEGIGQSKLADKVERHLGVSGTARNLRTVRAMLELAGRKS
ncbi:DUF1697 domain-containing protein [Parvularcula sp. LCG005]|uniref:DUF1697 domain-containing protein n=1 Tax=Parvularcula sp. LCG005 TaxID=3078805 RepID=UPI002942623C|nr:DUF1697 domain-containing protein [Parvularcula sp. LCG005]WOI52085.1 DUF1697 domain-containing protein [Parvularcula sp. LCG005]